MSEVACFLLHSLHQARRGLRRIGRQADGRCSGPFGYHTATTWLPELVPIREEQDGTERLNDDRRDNPDAFATDARWPDRCGCGYVFTDEDHRQIFWLTVYGRVDGQPGSFVLRSQPEIAAVGGHAPTGLPPGAMYFADWYGDAPELLGPDGRALVVMLPNGREWHVDGRASNCDSPCASCGQPYHAHYPSAADARPFPCTRYQDARPHKCWVRHGEPPNVTVDKNGVTCGAGAGSIASGEGAQHYHGFLRGGRLVGA